MPKKISSWHVGVAAEAFAAAQFARFGCDVSVQYGADQPEYDLLIVQGDHIVKVSVKGSQDGAWGLSQSYIKNADYHRAADDWLTRHSQRTVMCLVQFKDTKDDQLPRMYLARPSDIAKWLKAAAKGRGDTTLHEHHAWASKAAASGTIDNIPSEWLFTRSRLTQLIGKG